jgi:pimeloyl-ACP methyl ester carboxylesterase
MRETEQHLDLDGVSVFVRDVGSGPPVVLINGIGAHTQMWGPMEQELVGRRVISFDAPGTGRSDTTLLPRTMGRLADLVGLMFDAMNLDRADVVGYSFGGGLAQQFARQSPDRVRRLVLASTLPGWGGVPGYLRALLSVATPLRYYSRSFYEGTAAAVAGGRARNDPDYVRRLWQCRSGNAPSFTGYGQQLWAMTFWSSLPWLAQIQAPTLIVVGDDDPLVPLSNPLMMGARMPCSRIFIGRGEGHFQLLDAHGPALTAIEQFLSAARFDEAEVWRSAATFEPDQVAEQMRRDGLGALPWGAISAVVRRLYA